MLYGIFDDEAGGGIVGDLCTACSVAVRTGANSWDDESGENMAVASRSEEAP